MSPVTTRALHVEDVPVAPVVYDDSDPACRRGPLGEVRYAREQAPHDPRRTAGIFVREDGGAFSYQRQEILLRSAYIARFFQRDCGLGKGDAVFVADASVGRRLEWTLGCYRIGAVPIMVGPSVPITFLHRAERMHIKAVLVESSARGQEIMDMLRDPPSEVDDPCSSIMGAHLEYLNRPRPCRPMVIVATASNARQPDLQARFGKDDRTRFESLALWASLETEGPPETSPGRGGEELLSTMQASGC